MAIDGGYPLTGVESLPSPLLVHHEACWVGRAGSASDMEKPMKRLFESPRSIALSLGRNSFAFVTFWVVSSTFVQFGERFMGGWPASESGSLLGCVTGVVIALRLRARGTAFLLAALTAYSASELTIHAIYGIRAAQGAPTHFAVMGAGALGVVFGALLMRSNGRQPASHPLPVKGAARIPDNDTARIESRTLIAGLS